MANQLKPEGNTSMAGRSNSCINVWANYYCPSFFAHLHMFFAICSLLPPLLNGSLASQNIISLSYVPWLCSSVPMPESGDVSSPAPNLSHTLYLFMPWALAGWGCIPLQLWCSVTVEVCKGLQKHNWGRMWCARCLSGINVYRKEGKKQIGQREK